MRSRTRVRAELLDVGTCGRWRDHGVADAGAARRVEQRGRVADRAADAVLDREPALVADRAERDATLARLEPDQPATRRRDANGSAAVTGVGERHHSRRHRRGRAAARSAGRARRVPRVVRRTPRDGLGGRHTAQLRAIRAAGDHQPRRAIAADECRVRVGDVMRLFQRDVSVADPLPGVVGEEVLDEERHTAERPVGEIRACRDLAGVVEPADHDRVECRVDSFDALDRRFQKFGGRHVARRDERRLIGRIHPTGLVGKRTHECLSSTNRPRLQSVSGR